jgi:hypothetical protein
LQQLPITLDRLRRLSAHHWGWGRHDGYPPALRQQRPTTPAGCCLRVTPAAHRADVPSYGGSAQAAVTSISGIRCAGGSRIFRLIKQPWMYGMS